MLPRSMSQLCYEKKIDVAAERERLTKEIAKLEKALNSAEKQLGNPAFLGKAPANVVEGLKKQEMENSGAAGEGAHCAGIVAGGGVKSNLRSFAPLRMTQC